MQLRQARLVVLKLQCPHPVYKDGPRVKTFKINGMARYRVGPPELFVDTRRIESTCTARHKR